jgi:hypothetical protein
MCLRDLNSYPTETKCGWNPHGYDSNPKPALVGLSDRVVELSAHEWVGESPLVTINTTDASHGPIARHTPRITQRSTPPIVGTPEPQQFIGMAKIHHRAQQMI